jgi:hypothetical protein
LFECRFHHLDSMEIRSSRGSKDNSAINCSGFPGKQNATSRRTINLLCFNIAGISPVLSVMADHPVLAVGLRGYLRTGPGKHSWRRQTPCSSSINCALQTLVNGIGKVMCRAVSVSKLVAGMKWAVPGGCVGYAAASSTGCSQLVNFQRAGNGVIITRQYGN